MVGVRADTAAGPREFRADFVIACDGRASVIRKRADFPQDRIMQSFDVMWGHVPGYFLDGRIGRAYIGNGHLLIIYPSPEGHMQFGWIIDKGTFGDIRKDGRRPMDQGNGTACVGRLAAILRRKSRRSHPSLSARRHLRPAPRMDRTGLAPDRRRGASDVSGRRTGNQRRAA